MISSPTLGKNPVSGINFIPVTFTTGLLVIMHDLSYFFNGVKQGTASPVRSYPHLLIIFRKGERVASTYRSMSAHHQYIHCDTHRWIVHWDWYMWHPCCSYEHLWCIHQHLFRQQQNNMNYYPWIMLSKIQDQLECKYVKGSASRNQTFFYDMFGRGKVCLTFFRGCTAIVISKATWNDYKIRVL